MYNRLCELIKAETFLLVFTAVSNSNQKLKDITRDGKNEYMGRPHKVSQD